MQKICKSITLKCGLFKLKDDVIVHQLSMMCQILWTFIRCSKKVQIDFLSGAITIIYGPCYAVMVFLLLWPKTTES